MNRTLPQPSQYATDPIVHPAAVCCGKSGHPCGAPINPIHIYEGKGSRPEMRGAICQSVCPYFSNAYLGCFLFICSAFHATGLYSILLPTSMRMPSIF